jgi:uroporphyrinogen decarboxylase
MSTLVEHDFMELTQGLDVGAFWAENELCGELTLNKPRCSASFAVDDHWLFEFLDVSSTVRYYHDKEYRDGLHRQANGVTKEYVGAAFFDEDTWVTSPKRIENLFGSKFAYHEGSTPWLMEATDDPTMFAHILDLVAATDLEEWSLPHEYLTEWEERRQSGKRLPKLGTGSRGPATILTAVLGAERAVFWMIDHPDLMRRFRDLLAEKMVAFNTVLRVFSGNESPGWWITDDNCCLLSPDLYREFCSPVLHTVLEALAPGEARRHQHSDSAMGHLLDQQYELGIRSVNYGPEVDVALIREKMPDARINGHLPPFLLRNGEPSEIENRIVKDFEKAGASGGLNVTTAGSLAAGTGVGRMRWFMKVVQERCRYD